MKPEIRYAVFNSPYYIIFGVFEDTGEKWIVEMNMENYWVNASMLDLSEEKEKLVIKEVKSKRLEIIMGEYN